ncbi:MAG: PIG-L family deacetylase [Acidobacteria bacterium]|nr:PIG-L family deacetylase [Acidobacteriota bacterium]
MIRFIAPHARAKAIQGLFSLVLLGSLCLERADTAAVSRPSDAAAVAHAIKRLPVVGSVLLTGAHPDDENSTLLPYLTRGVHVRAAYLSATRGDGGQNLIGNELFEALGILRTEELLAARRIDGAEQYFGQEFDFGFSKSLDETMQKWGHDEAVGDFVRIVRRFRPDVLISRFSGTPSDGHGHHQAAGVLTKEAFRAAADPNRYPEQLQEGLKPWQASKLFLNISPRAGSPGPNTRENVSFSLDVYEPLYGKTFPEIGAESRSMHRSQGMGTSASRQANFANFRLLESIPPGNGVLQGLFDGVDLTLNRFTTLSGGSPAVASAVQEILKQIQTAHRSLTPYQPASAIAALAYGLARLREMRQEIASSQAPEDSKEHALFLLKLKEEDFVHAIGLAGGVRVETIADKGEVIPGETFTMTVTATVRAADRLKVGEVSLKGPANWHIERVAPAATSGRGPVEAKFKVTVPPDAAVSQPYWLEKPRVKDRYSVTPAPWNGDAANPPLFTGAFEYSVSESAINVKQESGVVYRLVDRIYGEREKPLAVIPAIGVWLEPRSTIFPSSSAATQPLLAKVRNNRGAKQQGAMRLNLKPGWRSNPPTKPFELAARGDEASARLEVAAPSTPLKDRVEEHVVTVAADLDGQSFSTSYQVIDYPHIQTRYLFRPAVSKLERVDVKIAPGLHVGYVMGTGDSVPEALRLLGVSVTLLTPEDISFGNLSRFNVIMTGIRAYEVRRDLITNNARLMEYVSNGGLMIVQYSRARTGTDPIGPYPMTQTTEARVSDENAPVEILEPVDPFFRAPNRITEDDFKGWVQERGLYFMDTWAPEYRSLLSSHDPREPPQKGGMLLASYGKGLYLYTAYAWFRQLPAGVPGAYRLLANMISLKSSSSAKASPKQR